MTFGREELEYQNQRCLPGSLSPPAPAHPLVITVAPSKPWVLLAPWEPADSTPGRLDASTLRLSLQLIE